MPFPLPSYSWAVFPYLIVRSSLHQYGTSTERNAMSDGWGLRWYAPPCRWRGRNRKCPIGCRYAEVHPYCRLSRIRRSRAVHRSWHVRRRWRKLVSSVADSWRECVGTRSQNPGGIRCSGGFDCLWSGIANLGWWWTYWRPTWYNQCRDRNSSVRPPSVR